MQYGNIILFFAKKIRLFETVYTPQIRIGRLHISFLHYIHTRLHSGIFGVL